MIGVNMLDALLIGAAKPLVQPCKVTLIGDDLPEPYKSAFWQLINTSFDQGGYSTIVASKKLAAAGIQIGGTVIGQHRRGDCKCDMKG